MATSKSNRFEEYVRGLLELLKEWGASFSNNEPNTGKSLSEALLFAEKIMYTTRSPQV